MFHQTVKGVCGTKKSKKPLGNNFFFKHWTEHYRAGW